MGPPPSPEEIAQTMSNPMVQSQLNEMLQNPQFLDMIIQSNPQLRAMGPEVRQYMQSPLFRQMMTDPNTISQMARATSALRGGGGGGLPAFPAGLGSGSLGAQAQEGQQQQQGAQGAQPGTGEGAQPNLFGMLGEGGQADPMAFLRSMMGAAPAGGAEGGAGGAGAGAGGDPGAFLRSMMGAEGAAGANPFAGLFGPLGGVGAPQTPADTRPPEERYAEQLRQLNDMGFYDFDRNVEALRRSGGSVQGAVNQLLGG